MSSDDVEIDRRKSVGERDAEMYVRNAKDLLAGFEDESVEVKQGAIKHAIDELRAARRSMPDDY